MTKKIAPGLAWVLGWVMALAATAVAGGPNAIGSLVGSRDAVLDGQVPLPHTVLLNGDKVAVNGGLAMVTLDRGNRMILGSDSEAIFLRETNILTVRMARGHLSFYHPAEGSRLQVKAGGVTVAPAGGPGTLAELSLADGLLVVTAKNGGLKVEMDGATREVEKGGTLTVAVPASGSPAPSSPGSTHLKHIWNRNRLVDFGIAAGAASSSAAAVALTRSSQPVSPVMPGP